MKSRTTKSAFCMECAITATIAAPPDAVWALLTDAAGFPAWNSTVASIEGEIAEGQRLKLRLPNGDRVFTPKVSAVEPGRAMTWSDGMAPMFQGVRTFRLTARDDGTTDFEMREELRGVMLPMIKGSLPDFAPIFEAYARDLKRAAEARAGGAS